MRTKLPGELFGRIIGDLASSVGTPECAVLERAIIAEGVVTRIQLEFHADVDERDVGYDTGVSMTSRLIYRNIGFDFGIVFADAYVWMTMRVD
jgi:hypothetical protein